MLRSLMPNLKPTTDSETRVNDDDHIALRLWLRLLTCSNLIRGHLRSQLRIKFQSTLPRFDLLSQLDRKPEGLTMGALSKHMMVSSGNVTGLVAQLSKAGLISRFPHPENRRIFIVKLTPQGRKLFDEMAREHEVWVQKLFGDVTEQEVQALMHNLSSLKKSAANHLSDDS